MERTAEIKITVTLDEKNIPKKISWQASDAGMNEPVDTNAFMLSVWDSSEKNTLGIDLWTEEMLVDDMKIYFFQTMFKMAQTFESATKNSEAAEKIRKFADEFAVFLNGKTK